MLIGRVRVASALPTANVSRAQTLGKYTVWAQLLLRNRLIWPRYKLFLTPIPCLSHELLLSLCLGRPGAADHARKGEDLKKKNHARKIDA